MKKNLYNYTLQELTELIEKSGMEKYRANQIFNWLYKSQVILIDDMINLPKNFISKVKSDFEIFLPEIIKETKSKKDETTKYLLNLKDGAKIENVLIFDKERITLCASTQVGCGCGCKFCSTATLGFKRNLEPGEIVSQIMLARRTTGNKLTNIVFMGMGEPLLNWENLHKAILIISDKNGLNFSQTRMTISTVGIIPAIKEIADLNLKINLAISLICVDDNMRSELIPLNKKYPLSELVKAAAYYNKQTGQQITFEYVMFKDINDSEKDAIELIRKLKSTNYKINLIPYNSSLNRNFKKPDEMKIIHFQKILKSYGIKVFIRKEKGADIKAACGQLAANAK